MHSGQYLFDDDMGDLRREAAAGCPSAPPLLAKL